MKTIIIAVVALTILASAVAAYLLFTGPHMEVQDKVKTYSSRMQLPPPGTVAVESAPAHVAPSTANPVAALPENVARGRAYYEYYCRFCHGEKGKGGGEVGQSYDPRPADLNSERVRMAADAMLYEAMLTGAGHAPVLGRVVPPEDRWYIVLYVRSLADEEGAK